MNNLKNILKLTKYRHQVGDLIKCFKSPTICEVGKIKKSKMTIFI